MAIKRVNPTSSGRRFQTYAAFDEITKKTPEKALVKRSRAGAETTTAALHCAGGAADIKGTIESSISNVIRMVSRPRSRPSNTIRTAAPVLPCCITPMAKSVTFWHH